ALLPQLRDPALRQPALLRALDQVLQQAPARGPRLAALLGFGHERLRLDGPVGGLDGDVDLLREPGRHALLAMDRAAGRRRGLEQPTVAFRGLVFGEVGAASGPEAALDVEHQPVAAQDRGYAAREEPRVDAVLRRPLADVPFRERRPVREV